MTPMQRMEQKKDSFTPNEITIYQTICENPSYIISLTTSALAQRCGVSQPAITRFIKNLGYSRFQDFRTDLIQEVSGKQSSGGEERPELADKEYDQELGTLLREITACEPVLNDEYLNGIADYLSGFRRIYACGESKSFQPAELFEIFTRKLSMRVHAVRRDFLNEVCDYLEPEDLLVLFSVSGRNSVVEYAANTQANIMLVTANPHPACEKMIDKLVVIPTLERDPEDTPVSPVLFDIFVDFLAKILTRRAKAKNQS